MTIHLSFRFGDYPICLEGAPDHATCAVRKVRPERLRTRMPVQHSAQVVLERCDDGTAADLDSGGLSTKRIVGFDAGSTPSTMKRPRFKG
jgi:hypothetical protein